jgi:hypothetical protein
MVRRIRHNIPGRPSKLESRGYSVRRRILLTVAAVLAPLVLDTIVATRRAQGIAAILAHGGAPNQVIMATGRYVTTVDALPACQAVEQVERCPEVVLHARSFLGATYSFRIRFETSTAPSRVERRGPWWFSQPFHAAGS